ncbi:MAG: YqcC family protein [Phycisphaeraceae bacterium]|nr:YqcC family protein [Phycisphaeraceae bacterium]MCW5763315.1 YqcC family protein [Phycisphaeraceae bacterium]
MHEADSAAERFELGVRMLRTTEPTWAMQMELASGGDIELLILEESLGGKFERIAGIVHHGLTPIVEAFARIGLHEGHRHALGAAIRAVRIRHEPVGAEGTKLELGFRLLLVTVDASLPTDEPPPIERMTDLLRFVLEVAPPATEGHARDDAAVSALLERIEAAMHEAGLWPGPAPDGPLEVVGAFGCDTMTFPQWLAWVFVPRVRTMLATGEAFPPRSQVGLYAARILDPAAATEALTRVLAEFDDMVTRLGGR